MFNIAHKSKSVWMDLSVLLIFFSLVPAVAGAQQDLTSTVTVQDRADSAHSEMLPYPSSLPVNQRQPTRRQQAPGSISGTVMDKGGDVLQGARVALTAR